MLPSSPVVRCSATGTPADQNTLARFRFAGEIEPGDLVVPAPLLWQRGAETETWYCSSPVIHLHSHGALVSRAGDTACVSFELDDSDSAGAGMLAYETLAALQAEMDMPQLLRVWHFLPGINDGAGDLERYRLFCQGRRDAIEQSRMDDLPLPAATVVGSAGGSLVVQALICRDTLTGIENPRQISAFRYPRQYGPKQPAFARAARVGNSQLLLSGTASIVGHETRHAGDVAAQFAESLTNIRTLIATASPGDGQNDASLDGLELLRVYLRSRRDLPALQAEIDQLLPAQLPCVVLEAELCRADLLVELEAAVNLP